MTEGISTPPKQAENYRLRGLTIEEMEELLASAGFQRFRGRQLFHWVHRQGVRNLEEMKNLPRALRDWLAEHAELGGVSDVETLKQSSDGSYKFLFLLDDGRKVESVLMPDPEKNYWTQCLSSQVGCAVDCKFCVTGFNGFFRQLRADEIVDQVLFARRHLLQENPEANYRNLVYMGMGEPLLNTDAVIKSIRLVTHQEGVNLSARRVTVSTSGIIPGMVQLAEAKTGAKLALSLNASSQKQREEIMPITKKYPIDELMETCKRFDAGRNRVTFEYVLMGGRNDSLEDAQRLAKLCRGVRCKINLIPWNPSPVLPFERPETEQINRFAQVLLDANYTVSVRWSKALDVDGACGQLAGQHRQRQEMKTSPEGQEPETQRPTGDLDFFATVAADEGDREADR